MISFTALEKALAWVIFVIFSSELRGGRTVVSCDVIKSSDLECECFQFRFKLKNVIEIELPHHLAFTQQHFRF